MEQALFLGITFYLLAVNLAAFLTFTADKRRAQRGSWRIPERRLLLLAVAGGALGAFIGMRTSHHKTRKPAFSLTVPLLMTLQVVIYSCFAAFSIYSFSYYHATDEALASLASDAAVTVHREKEGYLFDGPGTEALLVFYPGGKVETEAYAPLMRRLAEGGLDCALVDVPYRLATLGVGRAQAFVGQGGYASYYVGGHSLGGVAASMFAADHTDELSGLALLASYTTEDLSTSDLAVLCASGSNDEVLNPERHDSHHQNLPATRRELVIAGGNHAGFGDYGPQRGDGQATITADEQQRQTAEALLAIAGIRPGA